MKKDKQNKGNNNLPRLISKLKNEDSTYANLSKIIQTVYWVFIPLFLLMTIREYTDSKSINDLISGSGFMLSFLIFAIFFRKYYKEYNFVDYSLPTIEMLKKAVSRYQPFQKKSLWLLLALVSMDVGLTCNNTNENDSIILNQSIYWGLMILAVICGLILWYVRYKPIRDEALQMIREIEGE